jgi:hypothetical protein
LQTSGTSVPCFLELEQHRVKDICIAFAKANRLFVFIYKPFCTKKAFPLIFDMYELNQFG